MSSRFNLIILGTLFGITAFDTLLLAFAIPRLISEYGFSHSAAGLLGTILMAGVGVGAVVLGALSDVVGRRKVIFSSIIIFTLSTGLLSFTGSYSFFAVFLFSSGFGLGGGLTLSIAYLPEVIEESLDKYMCYFESFWGVGALSIVTASYFLVQSPLAELFLIGALPIALLPLFYKLPDVRVEERKSVSGNVRNLIFSYGKITIIIWSIWFCGVFTYYGVFLWLPSIMMSEMGYTIGNTILIPIYGIQIVSPLVLSLIIKENNTERLLAAYSFVAAISTLLFIYSKTLMFVGMLTTSFFSIGGWVLLILTTQKSYPQSIRGLGVGSAASVGRVGGIIAPYLTGYLMDVYGTFKIPFWIFVLLFLIMAMLALSIRFLDGKN
ncbi:hypothetical protein DRP05_02690 [Archaeoglobales archaeon]|nr:MAG: hypothetical protein DRP05_02690 [Archaeoglobales archaeon]